MEDTYTFTTDDIAEVLTHVLDGHFVDGLGAELSAHLIDRDWVTVTVRPDSGPTQRFHLDVSYASDDTEAAE